MKLTRRELTKLISLLNDLIIWKDCLTFDDIMMQSHKLNKLRKWIERHTEIIK